MQLCVDDTFVLSQSDGQFLLGEQWKTTSWLRSLQVCWQRQELFANSIRLQPGSGQAHLLEQQGRFRLSCAASHFEQNAPVLSLPGWSLRVNEGWPECWRGSLLPAQLFVILLPARGDQRVAKACVWCGGQPCTSTDLRD